MSFIELYDKNGARIHSIPSEYDDPFTLESFETLITAHNSVGKNFILAQVTTKTGSSGNQIHYSFYNAYHLNKRLFQTQVYMSKKLIHRLNVLNPLTNTEIVGEISYFMVQSSAQLMPFSPGINRKDEMSISISNTSSLIPSPSSEKKAVVRKGIDVQRVSKDDMCIKTAVLGDWTRENYSSKVNKQMHFSYKDPNQVDSTQSITATGILESKDYELCDEDCRRLYKATYIGSDVEYLEKSDLRFVFKSNALSPEDVLLLEMPPFPPINPIARMEMADSFTYPSRFQRFFSSMVEEPEASSQMGQCQKLFHSAKCHILAIMIASMIIIIILWSILKHSTEDQAPQ